jgi:hypothetical protein
MIASTAAASNPPEVSRYKLSTDRTFSKITDSTVVVAVWTAAPAVPT